MALRCLIVDDSARFLRAAAGLLERQGISVVGLAHTGTEAIARVAELRPDVVLVDIDLGEQSGFEVARQLRQQGDGSTPRIIMISSHAEQDFEDLVAASPVAGFVAKSALSAAAIQSLLTSP